MSYGSSKWEPWVLDEEESLQHIKVAYDAGINAFDTADVYSNGESEIVLGKAIKQFNLPRDEIVVLTKLYNPVTKDPGLHLFGARRPLADSHGYINQHGLSRKHVFDSVKHSLERLQLDYIDVLQCHRFDNDTPVSETMQALHDVVQAGYVRYIGMSSCHAWQFHVMQNYAITHNLTPFISMQNHYNLLYREEEREMFPTLKHFGVGSIPWSPLARGLLTRPYVEAEGTGKTKRGETDWFIAGYLKSEPNKGVIARVEEIAKKKGISMAQVATAWVMHKEGVSAPIVGTTSLDNLMDILGAINVQLSEEEIKYLEELYSPMAVLGHN